VAHDPWTEVENDAVVADYFAMLAKDIAQKPYSKAYHNRFLQGVIKRSKGSIEFKHQNISAVLKGLGQIWIKGYMPAFNFQASLAETVVRALDEKTAFLDQAMATRRVDAMREPGVLWIGPSPNNRNTPPPEELEQMVALARKFDVAGRDERNRALGLAGERLALSHERAALIVAGRQDLADAVRWTSDLDGDGAGYDISSFEPDGRKRLIEVKTTNGWERTPFYISSNELRGADQYRTEWCLLRIWDFSRQPRAFEVRHPLEAHVNLTATSFQATFH
jgi:hypothetical protein